MSSFVVSARKYRPVRFDEVVGQQHVSQTLKNALQTDHLAHAFLFCGPRGVGKTTNARILAKVLNCQNRTPDFEPCNSCDSCQAFNRNASLNITELDAASNNSVEHIRALIEQVRFQPQQGKYKIFIIDEVHMLSQAAFNAFLKTLEEPPAYAIFILATTEKHKILPTILSRCQIFDFKRIQVADIVEHLQHICAQEGITADPDALHIIGQKADGALRDALSIFDRITSFSGKEVTYQAVIDNLNVLDYDYFFRAVDQILTEDRSGMMLLFDEVLNKGFDEDLFVNGLAAHLRNLLVCKDTVTLSLLDAGEKLKERYHQQSALAPTDLLLTALNLTNDCDINFRLARNKRLHVELSLLKMVSIRRAFSLQALPTSEPEKKNPDGSNIPSISLPEGFTSFDSVAEPFAKQNDLPLHEVQKTTPNPYPKAEEVAVPEPENEIRANPQPPSKLLKNKLTIGGLNPAAMLAEIKANNQQVAAETATSTSTLSQEKLDEYWQVLLENQTETTLGVMMKMAKPWLKDEGILIKVGSQRAAAAIRESSLLIDFFRQQFSNPQLAMQLEEDESLREPTTAPKKRLTAKDKFLAMREKQPALEELRKRFDLRPEE